MSGGPNYWNKINSRKHLFHIYLFHIYIRCADGFKLVYTNLFYETAAVQTDRLSFAEL